MITVRDLSKVYRTEEIETQALENVNLHIDEGEFVSIMGPSGCGKSTLLNLIGLLNVELPLFYRHVPSKERRRLAEEVLARVGLSHRMKHHPGQLSGGQCQRVAIARAIIGNPKIILADEPTGNLDSNMGAEVMNILHSLNQEDHRTIVMVTHNEEQARQTSRIIRFFDGHQIN